MEAEQAPRGAVPRNRPAPAALSAGEGRVQESFMHLRCAIIVLATGSLLAGGAAEARTRHLRHAAKVAVQPVHGMSALARAQARDRRARELRQVASGDEGKPDVRFGAFKRDYSLDVYRPTIRSDQDGAVGMSIHLKTHD
jgi:hypothetical protein